MTLEEKITQIKLWLSKKNKFPFFGYLLFMLIPRAVKGKDIKVKDPKTNKEVEVNIASVPTAGVGQDAQYLYYNPKYFEKLNDKNMRAVLIHEVFHLALGHLWRIGARDPQLWNIAADLAINIEINEYQGMRLPKGCLLDKKYKGWATENIYQDLKKRIDQKQAGKSVRVGLADGQGGQDNKDFKVTDSKEFNGGCRGDHSKWYDKVGKDMSDKQKRRWKRMTQRAAEIHGKKQGTLPGELERLVKEGLPKVDWREVLINYVVRADDDFTYRRPDRRFLNGDLIMPSMEEGEKLEEVVIAIDTSGSIDPNTLNKFAGEVKGLLKSFRYIKAYCCSWDTQVYDWKEIDSYQVKVQYFGGGGTSTCCIFEEIEKRNIEPQVVLIFTDGYAEYPETSPDYDIIFLLTKHDYEKPPFGRHLLYDDKN